MNAISSSKLVNGLFGNGPQMNVLVIDEENGSRSVLSVKRTEATEYYILNNIFHSNITKKQKFDPKVKLFEYQLSNYKKLVDKRKKDRIRYEDGYDNLKTMPDSKKQRVFSANFQLPSFIMQASAFPIRVGEGVCCFKIS